MASNFDKFADRALGVSQRLFAESASYKSGSTTSQVKAVFFKEWVEIGKVSTYEMVCEVLKSEVASPKRGDEITRGSQTLTVSVVQETETQVVRLILKEKASGV